MIIYTPFFFWDLIEIPYPMDPKFKEKNSTHVPEVHVQMDLAEHYWLWLAKL